MITLLARIFIREDDKPEKVRLAYGILCGIVGILLNVLLFTGKFIAGTISKSIAITADAFNNLSDAGSSIVTLLGFKLGAAKPDPEHPFGHGRMEYVSGLVVAAVILIMAVELIQDSIRKILHPEATECSALIIVILLISIAVKLYMTFYNRRVAKKINSAAMRATAMDSLSDSITTSVVLITTLIAEFTSVNIDGYCGVAVGLFILYGGINAAKETLNPLLGQPPEACSMRGSCSVQFVIEGDGGVYPCDFYVLDDLRMGTVGQESFAQMEQSEAACRFREASRRVPQACRECGAYMLCRNGCRRDRLVTAEGLVDRNYYCQAYRMFFAQRGQALRQAAAMVCRMERQA